MKENIENKIENELKIGENQTAKTLSKRYKQQHEELVKSGKVNPNLSMGTSSSKNSIIKVLGILSILYFVFTIIMYILAFCGFNTMALP